MLDLDTPQVECAPIRHPFTFIHYGNEDFEDFLVAPIDRTAMSAAHLDLFFPYISVEAGHFQVNAQNYLIVAGYPDERAEMDVEPPSVSFQAVLLRGESVTSDCADMMYTLTLASDGGLSSFSGLSGAPVFAHSADNLVRVVGIVLRGHPANRICHFLDIRVILAGIERHLEHCSAPSNSP
jgi:hypothetical protein